jgi:hypothetical protein
MYCNIPMPLDQTAADIHLIMHYMQLIFRLLDEKLR